eukprot:TRINITY_DN327_c0_g3_i1.p4 TRINITY_DN327_c0_g3~~TRINITY_DN327_c0_g3_i1.p4  ORF type:complete len:109 (-),score=43.40 TRINITY_DN327_c0_g3_i1:34-360(-)
MEEEVAKKGDGLGFGGAVAEERGVVVVSVDAGVGIAGVGVGKTVGVEEIVEVGVDVGEIVVDGGSEGNVEGGTLAASVVETGLVCEGVAGFDFEDLAAQGQRFGFLEG